MSSLYRKNAGIVVFNKDKKVLSCRRAGEVDTPWQFPQGGIDEGETPADAAVRELREETGIKSAKRILTLDYPLRYDFIEDINIYKGQEQYWSLFYFFGDDSEIDLNTHKEEIEFTGYKWIDIEQAPRLVWKPKKEVYETVVEAFAPIINEYKDD